MPRSRQHEPVLGLLEDLVPGVVAEQRLGFVDLRIGDAGELDVGADYPRLGRRSDHGMQGRDVLEAVLGLRGGRDVAEARADTDLDLAPTERGEGVLQADA